MLRHISAILIFMTVTPALAQSTTFVRPDGGGKGQILINTSTEFSECSVLNVAKPINVERAEQWAIGIFNGALMYGPFQNNPTTLKRMNALDVRIFWTNIKNECKNNPQSKLTQAIQRVMDKMIFNP